MQVVINIDDKLYNRIKHLEPKSNTMLDELMRSVQNGTLLQKGHGRLIDVNELDNDLKERQKSYEHTFGIRQPINEAIKDGIIIARTHINYAQTIIEADKEE